MHCRAADGRRVARLVSHYPSLESRARAKGVALDTALAFVESPYRNETKAVPILSAYNELVASREDGSPATKTYYESTLKPLHKPDPHKWVHAFTVSDIERVLASYKNPNSKRTIRGAMATFFRWASRRRSSRGVDDSSCDGSREMSGRPVLFRRSVRTAVSPKQGMRPFSFQSITRGASRPAGGRSRHP